MSLSRARNAERMRQSRLHIASTETATPILLLPERCQTSVQPKLGYYNSTPWFGHVKNKMYAEQFFREVGSNL